MLKCLPVHFVEILFKIEYNLESLNKKYIFALSPFPLALVQIHFRTNLYLL